MSSNFYSVNRLITEGARSDNYYEFHSWFCRDRSLENRAKVMESKVRFLVKQGLLSGEQTTIWYQNRCPMAGDLYDDMRFNDYHGNFLGGVCPKSGHLIPKLCKAWWFEPVEQEDGTIYQRGYRGYFSQEFDTWKDFKSAIKTDSSLRNKLRKAWAPKTQKEE